MRSSGGEGRRGRNSVETRRDPRGEIRKFVTWNLCGHARDGGRRTPYVGGPRLPRITRVGPGLVMREPNPVPGAAMIVRPAVLLVAVVGSLALVPPPATGAAGRTFRAHWPLNEVKGHTARDTSGHHHNGTSSHVVGNGSGYRFNGKNSRVIVPTGRSLNPKGHDFSWRVTLSMSEAPEPVGESYDVLRKGLVTTKGGDYKLEIKNINGQALARCVVRSFRKDGSKILASVAGATSLADGEKHTITCVKTSTSITLKVDSLAPVTSTPPGGLGSVSNKSNLALGAKAGSSPATGFDWFEGTIYNAWVASP